MARREDGTHPTQHMHTAMFRAPKAHTCALGGLGQQLHGMPNAINADIAQVQRDKSSGQVRCQATHDAHPISCHASTVMHATPGMHVQAGTPATPATHL